MIDALPTWDAGEILAVGHAPHLDEVLARALGASIGSFTSLKKAGAALLELDEDALAGGRLLWLMPAGALRRLAKHR